MSDGKENTEYQTPNVLSDPVHRNTLLWGKKFKRYKTVCLFQLEALFWRLSRGREWRRGGEKKSRTVRVEALKFFLHWEWKCRRKCDHKFSCFLSGLFIQRCVFVAAPCSPFQKRAAFVVAGGFFYHESPMWWSADLVGLSWAPRLLLVHFVRSIESKHDLKSLFPHSKKIKARLAFQCSQQRACETVADGKIWPHVYDCSQIFMLRRRKVLSCRNRSAD